MEWRIAAMREADIEQVLLLEKLSFHKPWHRAAFLSEILSVFSICYTAKTSIELECPDIIAYICAQLVADELSILRIAVAPGWKRKGIGSALLETSIAKAAEKGAQKVFLEVRASNSAVMFYQRLGFHTVGSRPHYYPETGENALVMAKYLKEIKR